jgi:hypothetical protein
MELYGDDLMEFFQRVEVANFEIASDAFSSFKVHTHTAAAAVARAHMAVTSTSRSSSSTSDCSRL